MKKIISLFQRNHDGDRQVRDEVTPGAEWVVAGEGVATQKHDGTCCLIRNGKLYRRYEVKPGGRWPLEFEPATGVDPETGKQQGWVPVSDTAPADQYHREAYIDLVKHSGAIVLAGGADGTYELCGPKVQNNPENIGIHQLLRHGCVVIIDDLPTSFARLRNWFRGRDIEGIV